MSSFDWSHYYDLAKRLSSAKDEASLRTAVSRLYYYVFHLALARAESNAYRPLRQGTSHQDLWKVYDASPVPQCRDLAVLGKRIREWRVAADYRPHFPKLDQVVQDCLKDAEKFASSLAKLDSRFPKP